MSPRRLAERREALLALSAAQRARIALQLAPAMRVAGIAVGRRLKETENSGPRLS